MCDWCRHPHYVPGRGKPVFSVPGRWVTYVETEETGVYVEQEVGHSPACGQSNNQLDIDDGPQDCTCGRPWVAAVNAGEAYDPREQLEAFEAIVAPMRQVLIDGGRKRAAGTKPPWWRDGSHKRALYSHFYKHFGLEEKIDPDSGVNGLIHLATRALMLAYQETHGQVDPAMLKERT